MKIVFPTAETNQKAITNLSFVSIVIKYTLFLKHAWLYFQYFSVSESQAMIVPDYKNLTCGTFLRINSLHLLQFLAFTHSFTTHNS